MTDLPIFALCAILFVAGFIEDFVGAWHTMTIAQQKPFLSGLSEFVYVVILYAALSVYVQNLDKFWIVLAYALGSGVGSWLLVGIYKNNPKLNGKSHHEKASGSMGRCASVEPRG